MDGSTNNETDFLWQRPYVVMGNEDCLTELNETFANNKICCKDKLNEYTPLNIGAGLVCKTEKFVLAGVALSSSDWVKDNKPIFFANVPDYLQWIEKELQPYFKATSNNSLLSTQETEEY